MLEGAPEIYKKSALVPALRSLEYEKTGGLFSHAGSSEEKKGNVQSSWVSSLMSEVTRLMISLARATICRGS